MTVTEGAVNGNLRDLAKSASKPRARTRHVLVTAGGGGQTRTDDATTARAPHAPEPPPGFAPGGVEPAYAAVAIHRDDDLAAIFGKIDAADSPRVALVAPRGNVSITRQLGMRRLQRHLDLTGRDVILVTRSRSLRVRAREEGLPTVTHLKQVDFDRRGRAGLHLGWITLRLPTLGALLAVACFVTAVVLGALVLFWYVPTATVTVFVPAQTIGDTVDLVIDAKASEVNVEKGVVPGRRRETTVQRSIPGPATGQRVEGVEHAGVAVTFTNRTNRPVTVPKGTVVIATNGMPFTTGHDVNLQGRTGATGDAIALAQRPGTAGNVPQNAINRIEGPLAEQVIVTNFTPGEKGTDFTQTVVSEEDVQFIERIAEAYLIDAAKKDLQAQYAERETVFADSARLESKVCKPVPAIGQPARYTELECTARISMLSAADGDLRRIYIDRFRAKAGSDKMLLDDHFREAGERPGMHDATFDRLTVSLRVTVPVAAALDTAELRKALTGQSRTGVEKAVRQRVEGAPPPQVKLAGWALWLPRTADRITLVLHPAP